MRVEEIARGARTKERSTVMRLGNIPTDEIIELARAHRAGKIIQFWSASSNGWEDVSNNDPSWNFGTERYRVKPEPRVVYLKEYLGSGIDYGHVYSDDDCILPGNYTRIVKFVEQIPPS